MNLQLKKNHIRSLREYMEHINKLERNKMVENSFIAAARQSALESIYRQQETQAKQDAFMESMKQLEIKQISSIMKMMPIDDCYGNLPPKTTKKIEYVFKDEEPMRDEDRPTLADRLDKAEETIANLRERLEYADISLKGVGQHRNELLAERDIWKGRCERAEAMAQKLDTVISDLEKCRNDMGEQRFFNIVSMETMTAYNAPRSKPTPMIGSEAQYNSKCCQCQMVFEKGDKYVRSKKGYQHEKCAW